MLLCPEPQPSPEYDSLRGHGTNHHTAHPITLLPSQKYEFMMVGYTRADPNKTAAATALQSFKPDNTTVFQV